MDIPSLTDKESHTQKMFSCFDFSTNVTHGAHTITDLMTECKLIEVNKFQT